MYKTSDTPNSSSLPNDGLVEFESSAGNQEHVTGAQLLLSAYPIGAVYISVVSTSPATLFGGTWSAIAAGRVLVGLDSGDADFNSAEETGGSKTHTLSTAEIPIHAHNADHNHTASSSGGSHSHTASSNNTGSHTHNIKSDTHRTGTSDAAYVWEAVTGTLDTKTTESGGSHSHTITVNTSSSHSHTITVNTKTMNTGNAGSGNAHNNVQPYFVVYMWKRTA